MIVRHLDRVTTVDWGNGLSRRFLLESDRLGYTVTDTTVRAGTQSSLEYRNHLEACYCIEGKGEVIEPDGTSHPIEPGTLYALDEHDAHVLAAAPTGTSGWCACSVPHSGATNGTTSTPPSSRTTDAHRMDCRETMALREGLAKWCEAMSDDHVEADATAAFARDKWKLVQGSGLLGLPIDGGWGGLGQDLLTTMYVLEGLGQGCRDGGLGFSVTTHMVSTGVALQSFGSDHLKRTYLPQVCAGDLIGCHAITEPGGGSDALSMQTRATRDGDDFVLHGSKTFVSNGPIADLFMVYAKTHPDGGPLGVTTFLVERDTPGLDVGRPIAKMGLKTHRCASCSSTTAGCPPPRSSVGSAAGSSSSTM